IVENRRVHEGGRWECGISSVKVEIERELNPPRPRAVDWSKKVLLRHRANAEDRIDLDHVRPIQQIKGFCDQIQTSLLSKRKILEDSQIHVRQRGGLQ